jgi:hypothetical protein
VILDKMVPLDPLATLEQKVLLGQPDNRVVLETQEIPAILALVVLPVHPVLPDLLVPLDATETMETMELTMRIHLVFLEMMIKV